MGQHQVQENNSSYSWNRNRIICHIKIMIVTNLGKMHMEYMEDLIRCIPILQCHRVIKAEIVSSTRSAIMMQPWAREMAKLAEAQSTQDHKPHFRVCLIIWIPVRVPTQYIIKMAPNWELRNSREELAAPPPFWDHNKHLNHPSWRWPAQQLSREIENQTIIANWAWSRNRHNQQMQIKMDNLMVPLDHWAKQMVVLTNSIATSISDEQVD